MNRSVRLKMHIVMRPDISVAVAIVAAMHASLGTYLTYQDDPIMQLWQKTSFVKVLLKPLNLQHYHNAKAFGEHRIFTESSIGNTETCFGYRVVENPHPFIKDIPLWRPDAQ